MSYTRQRTEHSQDPEDEAVGLGHRSEDWSRGRLLRPRLLRPSARGLRRGTTLAGHQTDEVTRAVDRLAMTAAAAAQPTAGDRPRDRIAAMLVDRRRWVRLRLTIDVVGVCGIVLLAFLGGSGEATSNPWVVAVFGAIVLAMMHGRHTPENRVNASVLETFGDALGVASLASMVTITLDSALGGDHPLALAISLWAFSVVYFGGVRAALMIARCRALRRRGFAVPTLIIGAGVIGSHLAHRLGERGSYGLHPVGYLDADPLPRLEHGDDEESLPVLGTPDDLEEAVTHTGARHVILAFSGEPDHALVGLVRTCHSLGVGVSLVPRLYESINERATLDHVGGLPLLTLNPVDPKGWQFAVKHALDRTAALLGLLIVSPVMLAVAAAVRLSSPGPILFRQRRVGRDGAEFDVLKFRTMRVAPSAYDTGAVEFLLPVGVAPGGVEGMDRRTPVGRFLRDTSLDELPQLINVLRGDMSLVGPRPERPEYVERFARDIARYGDRHRVRSGITGWAQVHGLRGQTSIADRVEWDNYYIQNWSLRLDLRILLLTIAEVLRGRDSASARPGAREIIRTLSESEQ